ncbi:dienelactone hydrolase family protein [Nakamurella flavida]|uniref:Dienelactone hydrolase family protein n=1 Tax=Nakamurella flavida TaxID=363630 RepID=A0A939C1Z3_9ACTN|nr:dienelactone hydrolase family protein [Nakamurella flavida]MBM9478198.1 dienelactone hydrolase family protein [Nakamurella flavida]MDP9778580.1 carboxymethylenebutenolidase [Nakamurella flavida]
MPHISISAATATAGQQAEQGAYLAVPVPTADRPGPWPGVILVHDAFGPGDDMQEQADWLAAAGYVALMPDLFQGRSWVRCVKGVFQQLAAQRGPVFDRIEAARARLADRADCTGSVGVIGYCMGGGFALVLAGRPGYDVASVNYGPLPRNLDEVLGGACPIVASYGGKDTGLKGAAANLRAAVERVEATADIKEYPDAGHGFINRLKIPSPLPTLMRIAGVGYDHDSAADAKRRILTFFDQHLSLG